jgi:hypothetical protein
MGLFKNKTDPAPGGGRTAGGPDPLSRVLDPRAKDMAAANESAAPEVDTTRLMMSGVAGTAHVDSVHPALRQINLQETFEIELTVKPAEGASFSARVTQPVAEPYLDKVVAGATVKVKYDPDDPAMVFVDWAASPSAGQ